MTRPLSVLPPASAQEIAIAALAGQGQYGTGAYDTVVRGLTLGRLACSCLTA
jgi:hypothetical protein